MEEKTNTTKEPKFTEFIEEILSTIVHFVLNFPMITYTILRHPGDILNKPAKIKPLTYVSVNLLLSSAFWYKYFLPSQFMSPVLTYLMEPDLAEIKNFFFDTDSLTKALIGLIPIILIITLISKVISHLFRLSSKSHQILDFSLYLMGLIFIMFPVVFFLLLNIALYAFERFRIDLVESTVYGVFAYSVIFLFIILIIRAVYISSQYFLPNKANLKRVVFVLAICCFYCFNVRVSSVFYSEKKNDIQSSIIRIEKIDSTNEVILSTVISNNSNIDHVIKLSDFELQVGNDEEYEYLSSSNFTNLMELDSSLHEIQLIRSNSSLFVKIPFKLGKKNDKWIKKYFKDEKLDQGYLPGKANFKLETGYSQYERIEPSELKDIELGYLYN